MTPQQTIPVVDLRDFTEGDEEARQRFVRGLGDAFVEFGFAAVENHGVDPLAVADTYETIRRFFALPAQTKTRYEIPGGAGQRGYASFGREHAKNHSVADLKEFWHVGPELAPQHPLRQRMPPNVWPEEVPEFREASLRLCQSLDRTAAQLLRALASYLEADEEAFAHMIDGGNSILRLIRYPGPDEVEPEPGAVWAAAHEDINLITLLVEATDPGLELLRRDGTWMPIRPIPGQLIADAGDMLQHLTNGRIPSTTHRVLAPPDARGPRYSMPYFLHPHPDCMLEPLPSCVGPDRPRQWDGITAERYLNRRLAEIGLLEAADELD
ncbi:MAG: isopenicillin N synthase family oxygenase [Deltaproteobacteria bacterium]|nr:isopenicillin N synthase family oxygenase [Deltaproteobacteria bacterium]MCB9788632.1 isopenicillin N synthase family oxygenase [Deltaproteobacteria bacterium]